MIMILLNTWTAPFYYDFLYLACFAVSPYVIFICDMRYIQWFMQVQQHIYLPDYRIHSVAVSQRRNILIIEGK